MIGRTSASVGTSHLGCVLGGPATRRWNNHLKRGTGTHTRRTVVTRVTSRRRVTHTSHGHARCTYPGLTLAPVDSSFQKRFYRSFLSEHQSSGSSKQSTLHILPFCSTRRARARGRLTSCDECALPWCRDDIPLQSSMHAYTVRIIIR